jgi:hypothetical protein
MVGNLTFYDPWKVYATKPMRQNMSEYVRICVVTALQFSGNNRQKNRLTGLVFDSLTLTRVSAYQVLVFADRPSHWDGLHIQGCIQKSPD